MRRADVCLCGLWGGHCVCVCLGVGVYVCGLCGGVCVRGSATILGRPVSPNRLSVSVSVCPVWWGGGL